jgi:hypothetical protein
MSYTKTVAIGIGLCMLALAARDVVRIWSSMRTGKATGIALVRCGVIEFLVSSCVLGWLMGTAWYLMSL